MTEGEWLACANPAKMLAIRRTDCCGCLWFDNGDGTVSLAGGARPCGQCDNGPIVPYSPISSRKLRLFACAVHRLAPPTTKLSAKAAEDAERLADGRQMESDHAPIAWHVLNNSALDAANLMVQYVHELHASERRPTDPVMAALIRDVVGNPFRPKIRRHTWFGAEEGEWGPLQPWLTPAVVGMARRVYDDRTFDDLPFLADRLEEAGCESEELLRHLRGFEVCRYCMLPTPQEAEYGGGIYWCPGCGGTEDGNPDAYWMRSPGRHVRGCWALDLLIGKE